MFRGSMYIFHLRYTYRRHHQYLYNCEISVHCLGSMYISLNIQGTATGYNGTLTDLCGQIENATTYTFGNVTVNFAGYMTVDGTSYYGVHCGPVSKCC